ncbi:alpha-lytic protease prodomain-containing protein [Amycolatopsis pittospori]|uniref:alpha-lytic protease prodomain-containing protein n=1 Tax=Amycolatopsis pittospori TaxID=2749434 RepID=UPI0015F0EEDF|nr:alpha-lytic protease prodomain-containing protein [Amycolatopsis pittospori]
MKRTFVTTAAVLAAATALAVPGGMAVAASPVSPEAQAATEGVTPAVLDAMRRDLGLSADAAKTRLTAEARAAKVEKNITAALPGSYSGSWFDPGRNALVVGVTDPAKADIVRTHGAIPQVVRHSAAELDAAVTRLNAATSPGSISGWYVDVQRNTVTITTAPGTSASAVAFAKQAEAESVSTVAESAAAPRPHYDVVGGDAYYTGNVRCSVGFAVVGGYVTAGHCGNVGWSTTGYNRYTQGVFRGSSFPGDDMAWVQVNSSWTPRGTVNQYNGWVTGVRGSAEAPIGASVCRSGSTTGWRCGYIQAKNQTVRYPLGTIYGMTTSSACSNPGDSGGSFLSGNQAQGVLSGNSGDCGNGGVSFFQPVNEILWRYNLRLLLG